MSLAACFLLAEGAASVLCGAGWTVSARTTGQYSCEDGHCGRRRAPYSSCLPEETYCAMDDFMPLP